MVKFIFLADTHIGSKEVLFFQQNSYTHKIDVILEKLNNWIQKNDDIDFIIHGGDMVDEGTLENIQFAYNLFKQKIPIPVYLCLGNHDLTEQKSLDTWLNEAPEFFVNQQPDYSIQKKNIAFHIFPNQWENTPYYWKSNLVPHFLPNQISHLKNNLKNYDKAYNIIITHSPVHGIPSNQTGLKNEYINSGEEFKQFFDTILNENSCVGSVLYGHTHANMHILHSNVHFVSSTAFAEMPFEFKIIEITSEMIEMKTLNLVDDVDFKVKYNYNKTFVQGRYKDRNFVDYHGKEKILSIDSKLDDLLANNDAKNVINMHYKGLLDSPQISHFLMLSLKKLSKLTLNRLTIDILQKIDEDLKKIP